MRSGRGLNLCAQDFDLIGSLPKQATPTGTILSAKSLAQGDGELCANVRKRRLWLHPITGLGDSNGGAWGIRSL
jgi:hypothetical protein